jgi:hypothetical protein
VVEDVTSADYYILGIKVIDTTPSVFSLRAYSTGKKKKDSAVIHEAAAMNTMTISRSS